MWRNTRAKALCLFGLSLMLVGCLEGETKVDTSSRDAYVESLAKIEETLPESAKNRLPNAILELAMGETGDSENVFASLATLASFASNETAFLAKIRPIVEGKNALEIIRLADTRARTRLERQAKALAEKVTQTKTEITAATQDLHGARTSMENAKRIVEKISIRNAKYYWDESGFMQKAIIEFNIANGTNHAIRKIIVRGILETPGRSVPWVESSFNYEFSGGLEPGESQHLTLAPNMFGKWANAELKSRDDLVLTLVPVNFHDANKEAIVTVDSDDIARKERSIESLQEKLEKLQKQELELSKKVSQIDARNSLPVS